MSFPRVSVDVAGDRLRVNPETADALRQLQLLTDRYAPDGRNVLVVPFWPGAYPALGRRSPIWEIYAIFRHPASFELDQIARIRAADPGFVFVLDFAMDGHDDLRFSHTHPLMNDYIIQHFDRVPDMPDPAYLVYRARGASAP